MESIDAPPIAAEPLPAGNEPEVSLSTRQRVAWLVLLLVVVVGVVWGVGPRAWHGWKTRKFREQCLAAKTSSDWHTLREVAEAWGTWDPSAGRAWWFAAEAAQELENLEDLAECLAKVPPSDPKYIFANVEKANLEWTALNRPVEALATSLNVLNRDPRLTEIQSRVISFYAMNLQRAPMLKAIRAALEAGAEPKEAYVYLVMADMLTFVNGSQLNSRWLSAAPDELRFKVGLAVNTSEEFAHNADIVGTAEATQMEQEAMKQMQWFLEGAPHDPVLLTFLMYRAYLGGDVKRVGELLQQVDESGTDDHMVWVYRAFYYRSFDEFTAAEEALKEALRLHPMSPLAHHEYAALLRAMQRPAEDVEKEQKIAAQGRTLRSQVLTLGSALDISYEIFESLADYAEKCGDQQVAESIRFRLSPQ
ncbi:MAG: hypothetical protein JSS02_14870 [Planctomycetes bacterium]|nr:hypothetical protein [Planctomycetota bacterium]